MSHNAFPSVSLHNVAELVPPTWANGGSQLVRAPRSVGAELNVDARDRLRHPTGSELRFVPGDADSTVAMTLSANHQTTVRPFWGEFQSTEPFDIGREPTTHELSVPDRIAGLADDAETGRFDPFVCRLRFDAWAQVALHDVTGDCRPPRDGEKPSRRYLAYGTSITEGATSPAHLGYVETAAKHAGLDPLNLGVSGSAFCEPAMAEYLSHRDDWDVATLSLSVNMANRGFTVEQFHDRADHLVNAVAAAHPEKPIRCITLFPYHADFVRGDDPERAAAFRDSLERIVAETSHDDLSIISGPTLLSTTGLMDDVLHPGDAGMVEIGQNLATDLAQSI